MVGNCLEAVKLNLANFSEVKIYELGKHYNAKGEEYWLSGMQNGEKFLEVKGLVESLLSQLGVKYEILPAQNNEQAHPGRSAVIMAKDKTLGFIGEINPALLSKFGIKTHVSGFTINFDLLRSLANSQKIYQSIFKYPAVVEDLSLVIPEKILYQEVVDCIYSASKLVINIELIDIHENSKLLRLTYLDKNGNLTDDTVAKARNGILKKLKVDLKVLPKA
jgi:phenylalanyl-tRNA synthetase beta chain